MAAMKITAALLILGIEYALYWNSCSIAQRYPNRRYHCSCNAYDCSPGHQINHGTLFMFLQHIFHPADRYSLFVPYSLQSKNKSTLYSLKSGSCRKCYMGNTRYVLSMPFACNNKTHCDHIEPLKPWGFLLGDTMPPLLKNQNDI